MRSRRSATEIGLRKIILVAYTVNPVILQTVHVLVCFIAAEIFAFVWFVDNDCVLGGHDAWTFLLSTLSCLSNILRLRCLIYWKLSPIMSGPFFGSMDIKVVKGKDDGGGRE